MSSSDPAIEALLRDCLSPGRALGLARRLLEEHDLETELSPRGDVVATAARALSAVPLAAVFEALREAAPPFVPRIDALAEAHVPLDARLGRLLPTAPSLLSFVGRTELVEALGAEAVLQSGGHLHLHGPPASGRTTVGGQLARLLSERLPVVAWIDGRSEESAQRGLVELAEALGLRGGTDEEALGAVHTWLEATRDWALILDDCDGAPETRSGLAAATGPGRGRLVTLGRTPLSSAAVQHPLVPLPEAELRTVVERWSRRRAPADRVTASVGSLGEVAIVSAAWTVRELPEPTVGAAHACLSPEAAGLLAILRSLAPAPVPAELYTWPVGRPVPVDLPLGMEVLVRSPSAARTAAGSLVRRAWAYWLGDRLCVGSVAQQLPMPEEATAVAAALLLDALLREEVELGPILPHAAWMADNPEVVPAVRRALSSHVGRALLQRGAPEEAVGWLQRALAAAEGDALLPDSAMPGLLNDLGVAWRRAGRLHEARSVLEDALAGDLSVEQPDGLAVASTRANLGHVLRELGALEDAREQYLSALELRHEALGRLHPDCAVVGVQLGVVTLALGEREEARRVWTESLLAFGRRRTHRLALATVLRKLAGLDAEDGELESAIQKAERAHGLLVAEYDDPTHAEVGAVRDELVAYDQALDDARRADRRRR